MCERFVWNEKYGNTSIEMGKTANTNNAETPNEDIENWEKCNNAKRWSSRWWRRKTAQMLSSTLFLSLCLHVYISYSYLLTWGEKKYSNGSDTNINRSERSTETYTYRMHRDINVCDTVGEKRTCLHENQPKRQTIQWQKHTQRDGGEKWKFVQKKFITHTLKTNGSAWANRPFRES